MTALNLDCDKGMTKSGLIFTRYLYIYDEVRIALLISLLNQSESALFWGFELYYSGFENELFDLLWKIYYMFYFTLNPGFQEYFMKKQTEKEVCGVPKLISAIIENLMYRPSNCDVFYMTSFHQSNFDADYGETIQVILLSKTCKNIDNMVVSFLQDCFLDDSKKSYYLKKWKQASTSVTNIDRMKIVASAYLIHIFSLKQALTLGKNMFLSQREEDLSVYETMLYTDERTTKRAYRILPLVYKYSIDEENYLSLFPLERNRVENIKDCYWYHWEYYASFSPVWKERIEKYGGVLNEERKRVIFEDGSDEEEEFYKNYNYEPDEQKMEIQRKSIQILVNDKTWTMFYEKFGGKGLGLFSSSCFKYISKTAF